MPLSGRPYRYFYPRPPRGGRPRLPRPPAMRSRFLSTPSARRATEELETIPANIEFLSTPSARRATGHAVPVFCCHSLFLSTPSARRATGVPSNGRPYVQDFYPRPPRGGRRDLRLQVDFTLQISIHALREEGDCLCHAPCEGAHLFLSTPSARRATPDGPGYGKIFEFLSTPSARRATVRECAARVNLRISIHALREEGDLAPVCSR